MEKAIRHLLEVLDEFLDEFDDILDDSPEDPKIITIGCHTRRIDRAMNNINCLESGIPLPPKLGRKRKLE